MDKVITEEPAEAAASVTALERPGADDPLRALHHRRIRRVLGQLDELLPIYQRCASDHAYTLARDNLTVLRACYDKDLLSTCALEVLLEHLLALFRMCAHRSEWSPTPKLNPP